MPKAEVGSTKYIANKMKAKGLQRLRWYCQICEKQCRDENGFKQHTMSEGHVRAMLLVGEDPKKYIENYSQQFKRDFLQLLKTAHGEKKINMNNFYQEYIKDKEHVHMNATKWPSLTEFAKYLGREGICRVEEGDKGLEISFIDDSPEAIRRREDVKRKEMQAKGDEDLEAKMLARQIKKAKEEAALNAKATEQPKPTENMDHIKVEPIKVSLSLGTKAAQKQAPAAKAADDAVQIDSFSTGDKPAEAATPNEAETKEAAGPPKMSLSLSGKPKVGNPLAKKNPFAKKKDTIIAEQPKKMSNAERIMKEEIERKRIADERRAGSGFKRQRLE
ncbi:zinc finger protein RTS2 [Acrodontium crateriforme]|uniref:Zinc finger protein RTS2 n=1 Tax=Acrodontium crateriforme TaxID=150365 RepID=A0AAQ3M4G4_9PEZI|nr:zinc finger protein RTS2 [Acrodontium crateriforme]